ncbi:MAG TPA: hypothetical protein VMB19_11095 [Silvibacterium sp.]|nr:hypothetical protein [Silvibacterium sp.]
MRPAVPTAGWNLQRWRRAASATPDPPLEKTFSVVVAAWPESLEKPLPATAFWWEGEGKRTHIKIYAVPNPHSEGL